jgi:hypothetical protein
MQKARRHPTTGLRPLVSAWFQGLFTPLFRVLFTFPSRYLSTIGLSGVFSLAGWCRQIRTGFLRSRPTQDTRQRAKLALTGLSPSAARLPRQVQVRSTHIAQVLQPPAGLDRRGLGPCPFARHYSGNHFCFLLLRVLRCFSSPGSPPDMSGSPAFSRGGCPIRTPADQFVRADPRGFSQLIASFLASESLGIPHAPLSTSFPSSCLLLLINYHCLALALAQGPQIIALHIMSMNFSAPTLGAKERIIDSGLISPRSSPERRCSSHTFRYGYLVTT